MVASEDDKPKIAAAMRRAYERSNRCSRDDDGTLRLPKAHLSSVLLDLDASFRKKVLLRIEDDALVSVDDLLRHLEDTSKPVAVDKTLLAPGGSSTFTHPSTASSQIGTISTDEHLSEDEPRGGSFSTISNPLDVRDNSTLDTLARPNDLTGSERIWNHFDGYFATCFNKLDEFSREFEALRRSHESIEKNNAARDSSQRQAEDELLSLKTTQTEHEVVTSSRYKKLSQDLKTIQADVGNAIAEGMRFAKSLRAHQRTVETGLEIVKGQQKTAHRDVQALEDDLASMRDAFFVHETGASAKMFEEIARLTAKVHEIEQGVEKLAGSFEDRGAWPAQMDNDLPAAGNCITAGGEHVVHKTLASELSREFVDEFGSESSRIVELSESADIEGLKQLGIEEWRHIGIETSFSEELSDFENGSESASERGSCHKDALSPKVATTAGMVEIPAKNNAIDAVPGSEFLGGLEGFEDAAVARTESGYEYGSASRMTLGNDPNVGDKIVSKSSRIADVAAGEDIESPCDHGFPTSTVDEIPGRELAPEVASGEGTTYTKTKAAFPLGIPPAETTRESPKYHLTVAGDSNANLMTSITGVFLCIYQDIARHSSEFWRRLLKTFPENPDVSGNRPSSNVVNMYVATYRFHFGPRFADMLQALESRLPPAERVTSSITGQVALAISRRKIGISFCLVALAVWFFFAHLAGQTQVWVADPWNKRVDFLVRKSQMRSFTRQ